MRLTIIHCFLFVGLFVFLSVTNSKALSQIPQTTQSQPTKNSQAMSDLEDIKRLLREKKAQQEQQRKLLQDLQEAISEVDGGAVSSTTTSVVTPNANRPANSVGTTNTNNTRSSRYVTSESTLSRLEALELLNKEREQHEADLKSAQKEINLLKRQLEIANKQMDSYQRNPSPQAAASKKTIAISDGRTQAQLKTTKTRATQAAKQQSQGRFDDQNSEPQMSEKDRKALEEIEMMKKMLQERREYEKQQKRLIQDLQQTIETK